MAHSSSARDARQIRSLCQQFAQTDGLPFQQVLSEEVVAAALREENAGWRDCLFTPVLTLWAFLSQVLCTDGSCRAAVLRVIAFLTGRGQKPPSPKTDPYCKARARLPEGLLARLTRATGGGLHEQAPAAWRLQGRRVKIVDGTTASMPDTPANQRAYPQPHTQQPGLGFPLARRVVIFCLSCGAVRDLAVGPCLGKETGENALLRTLAGGLAEGDVLLGDRYVCSYGDIALLRRRRVDVVLRLHQRRKPDFRRGRRLGREDHVVSWAKPKCPDWLDEETYGLLPPTLLLREVRVRVGQRGFRTRVLVVVTTLLDPGAASAADLAALYRARWQAELDLRSLKVTLGMDVLRCQSPEMVRKEVWAHLLGYNLIRAQLAQAATVAGVNPRELSFSGGLQTFRAFAEQLLSCPRGRLPALCQVLWELMATYRVGGPAGPV
jgi:Transposase DDE domain